MTDFLSNSYLWLKSFHVISVIAWMAGIFYLPRLFVYHVERAQGDPDREEMFQTMERKLIRGIMNPAMTLTWIFGLLMVWAGGRAIYAEPWFMIKFVFVCMLTGYHHWASIQRKILARGEYRHNGRYYRIMNEIPVLLLAVIVIMVIVKPF